MKYKKLSKTLQGDLYTDNKNRILYATDASAYREIPVAVARPKNKEDIKKLIAFAKTNGQSLIPRAAGTSLAGQVVGPGIVVDVGKYMTGILEFNKEEKWVRVEPGVNLEELNKYLAQHGLFFGPETSTANRCMMGGMVGNNSCGLHSLVYGSTREHTLSVKCILSDGSEAEFTNLSKAEFEEKCKGNTLENKLYQNIKNILSDPANQEEIRSQYPDTNLTRRNTGYALDMLLETNVFSNGEEPFNFCKLIAGSEGTLAFITEIKLNLVPLPPPVKGLVCVHFGSVKDALQGNLIALKHEPQAIELMDHEILELTKDNREQLKNRFFVQGDPGAILIIEFVASTKGTIEAKREAMKQEMEQAGLGYHFPVVYGTDTKKVWNLRKAGLGVLGNLQGDAKPVSVIEDTAVVPEKLPAYIDEFDQIIKKYKLRCVYHAHIATGELHLRPILNLKDPGDVQIFHDIAEETATLVKKFNGSFSGEHGDGRLRGEFIPLLVGDKNYSLLKEVKKAWDPDNIINPGKIVDTPKMNTQLRYEPGEPTREFHTTFHFKQTEGILRAAEKCNGTADCRKSEIIGGTMCPSYMATRDEDKSTRARANILREYLTHSPKKNPFNHEEIYEVMDLCLSCKACKTECPSNVDVARLKAEFLQHYYDTNGVPVRSWIIGNISKINALGSFFPGLTNFFLSNPLTSGIFARITGFSPKRKMPLLHKTTLNKWVKKYTEELNNHKDNIKTIYLFNDEFTNFNDTQIGTKAIQLLNKLGYKVILPKLKESGRAYLSKGMLREAKKLANYNVELLINKINKDTPLVGIEPSAILAFRDEYPEMVDNNLLDDAAQIAKHTMLFDEFIYNEMQLGNISKEQFTTHKQHIKLHGHCQQKAVASTEPTKGMLSFPENYTIEEIPSGCCGMAGSFGYEKEHYDISMKIGEMVLFPAVREALPETLIAAPGTSCRHQIKDGTGRDAFHPIQILHEALA
jgi:FAD/FMN-containing dehydrogenase/Fe-S oxidoreductase